MIEIANVSRVFDYEGENDYELHAGGDFVVAFKHIRKEGLAACLRRAAEAVEAKQQLDRLVVP